LRNLKRFYDSRITKKMIKNYIFNENFEKNMCETNIEAPTFRYNSPLEYINVFSFNFTGMLWPKPKDSFEYKQRFYNRWNKWMKIITKESNDI